MVVTSPVKTPVLEMRGIVKTYPGLTALNGVDFTVLPAEVHALIGENGAGKSTLMKILAGAEVKDSGKVFVSGVEAHIASPQEAMRLGISIIYQEFNLVPHMNAAENIFLGREPMRVIPGVVDFGKMYAEAERLIDELGVKLDVRVPMNRLSVAQQQMVEIAKATSRNSTIIAMDEPSATLTEHELENLFRLIERLKRDGVSIVYISHRLEEIFAIADKVTVLRDGQLVETKNVSETDRENLIHMMVGRELSDNATKVSAQAGAVALEVSNLNRNNVLKDISFCVHYGEILGVAGLVGAGRTELARAIFGADQIDSGTIMLDGKPVAIHSPQDAIKLGIGLVTEDRKALGLVLGMTVRENISLANLGSLSLLGFMSRRRERDVARRYVEELMIKTPSIEQAVQNLSGGNQQKVVLAKWLFTQSKVLVFDEPTRGIDVGAKAEIYQLMNKLAELGGAIIMISSELPEIIGVSDRIIVMHEGAIAGEFSREEASQEKIMHLATGGE